MLQSLYLVRIYRDLLKYKLSYAKNKDKDDFKDSDLGDEEEDDDVDLKIGIIGCGQIGTMILTKLLEVHKSFQGMKIYVSTRQPHLLKEFKQEFEIEVFFNNERVARKCDVIYLCSLPFQADIILREIRQTIEDRNFLASRDKVLNKPIIISTLAAIGTPKLKLLATENTIFFRTVVSVPAVKAEITRTQSLKKLTNSQENLAPKPAESEIKSETEKITESAKIDEEDGKEDGSDADQEKAQEEAKLKEMQLVKFIENEAVGAEAGITPDFIVTQASSNLIKNLDDLFNIFDAFQSAFYSGEAQLAMKDDKEEQQIDDDKAVYEESILITILGENYMDFIDSGTGEWVNEDNILSHFAKLFNQELEGILRNTKPQNNE